MSKKKKQGPCDPMFFRSCKTEKFMCEVCLNEHSNKKHKNVLNSEIFGNYYTKDQVKL